MDKIQTIIQTVESIPCVSSAHILAGRVITHLGFPESELEKLAHDTVVTLVVFVYFDAIMCEFEHSWTASFLQSADIESIKSLVSSIAHTEILRLLDEVITASIAAHKNS